MFTIQVIVVLSGGTKSHVRLLISLDSYLDLRGTIYKSPHFFKQSKNPSKDNIIQTCFVTTR